jgi:hypothetical protein
MLANRIPTILHRTWKTSNISTLPSHWVAGFETCRKIHSSQPHAKGTPPIATVNGGHKLHPIPSPGKTTGNHHPFSSGAHIFVNNVRNMEVLKKNIFSVLRTVSQFK